MWLATKIGWFSIVRKSAGETHVRARSKNDLGNLVKACCQEPLPKILVTHHNDYCCRIIVSPEEATRIVTKLAEQIDYDNFKGVISDTPDQADKLHRYHDIHGIMEGYQQMVHGR